MEKKTLICASGRGSNFKALFHAVEKNTVPHCRIIGLITDRKNTPAAAFAAEQGLEIKTLDFGSFLNRSSFEDAFLEALTQFSPDLIMTLGYMRILSPAVVQRFPKKIMNIHPSLLPSFSGLRAQKQALDYGAKISGATVHFVDEGMDTGPVICQGAVEVLADDTEGSLSKRILEKEHGLVIQAARLFCADRLT